MIFANCRISGSTSCPASAILATIGEKIFHATTLLGNPHPCLVKLGGTGMFAEKSASMPNYGIVSNLFASGFRDLT